MKKVVSPGKPLFICSIIVYGCHQGGPLLQSGEPLTNKSSHFWSPIYLNGLHFM